MSNYDLNNSEDMQEAMGIYERIKRIGYNAGWSAGRGFRESQLDSADYGILGDWTASRDVQNDSEWKLQFEGDYPLFVLDSEICAANPRKLVAWFGETYEACDRQYVRGFIEAAIGHKSDETEAACMAAVSDMFNRAIRLA